MTERTGQVGRAAPVPRQLDVGMSRWVDVLLLVVAVAYAVFVGLLTILRGVPITSDVVLVALGFAVVLLTRARAGVLREWTPFLLLFLAYELMRDLADDAGLPVHAADVVAVERALFGGHLPTAVLQAWFHPASGVDLLAVLGTVVYLLHFPLPIVTGILLWRWRPGLFHPFVVALILLSFAGFVSYLLFPVAPPWMAAQRGLLAAPPGEHPIAYLKPDAFVTLAGWIGLAGRSLYDVAFHSLNANEVAAFPSLHAAYPVLCFLVLRRAFGRIGWVMLAYAGFVSLTVVYTADHWVLDVLAGAAYASVAWVVTRWLMDRRVEPAGPMRPGAN